MIWRSLNILSNITLLYHAYIITNCFLLPLRGMISVSSYHGALHMYINYLWHQWINFEFKEISKLSLNSYRIMYFWNWTERDLSLSEGKCSNCSQIPKFHLQIRVIINNKTILVNISAIAIFKTVSHTIHDFHINLQCSYFLTDKLSHL